MSSRKSFIDVAKGIGIILVVLGHLDADGQISRSLIYSFHMPLFFMLSGVFSNTKTDFVEYLKKNFLALYLPYFIFVLVDAAACVLLNGQSISFVAYDKLKELAGIGFGALNRPIWFLFALFIIKISYYFISKAKALKIAAVLIGIVFVFLNGTFLSYRPDFLWLVSVPCLSFYALGDIFKEEILEIDFKIQKRRPLFAALTVALLALLTVSANANICVDMTMYKYGNTALFFANALVGCFAIFALSVLLSEIRPVERALTFYGQNSVIVMVCHYYFCRRILPTLMEKLSLSQYLYSAPTQIIVLLLSLLALVPIILFSNRYLGFVFGKFKKRVI